MSFNNFSPTMWAVGIERSLEKNHVFVADTNRKYEGDVKEAGDAVRILGVARPTIYRTTDKNFLLPDVERPEDQAITLPIRQIAYFNYDVGDIDKAQAKPDGIMEALSEETSEGLADEQDIYVANLAKSHEAVLHTAANTPTQVNETNILKTIDDVLEKLYLNNVKPNAGITFTVPPWFYMTLKRAYTHLDTDNSDMIRNGRVGRYGDATFKMSTNCATGPNGQALVQAKTKRAIAFVNPMTHVEAYRPEKSFSDAVKGFTLFDAKIVRPKEMIVLNCYK